MFTSTTSLQKLSFPRSALINLSQIIKISNLPKYYQPSTLTTLFQKVSKIRCYNKSSDTLWIRFQNIKDRKACLILDGYSLNTKRIQVILDFKEEEIPVTWTAMHGITPEEKYKLSFKNISEKMVEERKEGGKSKDGGVIKKIEPEMEETMREIFSVRYLCIMLVLYLISIAIDKILE